MSLNVAREVAALQRLTVPQLRQRYAEVFGETTNANHRAWLIKRIVWRMQALAEGDLTERARRRAAELANDADLRLNPPRDAIPLGDATDLALEAQPRTLVFQTDHRLPAPGTVLTRPYKGRVVQVQVLADGFEY